MYVAFGNRVLDSEEIKKEIELNTDARVVSDLCKSSKREDIIAFKLSIDMDILRGLISNIASSGMYSNIIPATSSAKSK